MGRNLFENVKHALHNNILNKVTSYFIIIL